MVIGVLVSGILMGILATFGALIFGLPLWAAVLLYPVCGAFGSVGFILFALLRGRSDETVGPVPFGTSLR